MTTEVNPESRETKDAGDSFLEAINAAKTPAELNALMADRQRDIDERTLEQDFVNPFSSQEAAKAVAGVETEQELVSHANEIGAGVADPGSTDLSLAASSSEDEARRARQRGELPDETPRLTPDELNEAIAMAQTPGEVDELMRSQGLRRDYR